MPNCSPMNPTYPRAILGKRMFQLTLALLIGLFSAFHSFAQPQQQRELTLQEALQRAQSTWQPLKSDSLNTMAAQRESKAHPMLDPAQVNSEWGQINSVYRDQGLQINQTFRLPGFYKAQRNLAQTKLEGARIEQARSLTNLERDLISTYYTYQVLYQKRILLQHNDSVISETVKVLKQRHQRGQISGSDLNQILLIQGESSINIQKASTELENTLRWFQYLTAGEFMPWGLDSVLWTAGLGIIREQNPSPDLDLLANLSKEAKANSQLSQQLRKPGWTIGLRNVSIQGMGPDGALYPMSRRFNTFQAGLVLPLWGRPLREQAIADRFRSEAMHLNHKHGMGRWSVLQRNTLLEVADLQSQWSKFNTILIPLADELTQQANTQLASGELDLIEWTHNHQRIMQTRESYLQLAMDFNNALIRLRFPTLIP